MAAVPHPPMTETVERLEGDDVAVHFTHLNHTNPAIDPDSPERRALVRRGFGVAERGDRIRL